MNTPEQLASVLESILGCGSGGLDALHQGEGKWGFSWNRALSWAKTDERLHGFIQFLETSPSPMPQPSDDWCVKLNEFLNYPRNRVLFFVLSSGCWKSSEPSIDKSVFGLLAERHRNVFVQWLDEERTDRVAMKLGSGWRLIDGASDVLKYQGVPLGCGAEYDIFHVILEKFATLQQEAK